MPPVRVGLVVRPSQSGSLICAADPRGLDSCGVPPCSLSGESLSHCRLWGTAPGQDAGTCDDLDPGVTRRGRPPARVRRAFQFAPSAPLEEWASDRNAVEGVAGWPGHGPTAARRVTHARLLS